MGWTKTNRSTGNWSSGSVKTATWKISTGTSLTFSGLSPEALSVVNDGWDLASFTWDGIGLLSTDSVQWNNVASGTGWNDVTDSELKPIWV